MTTYRIYNETTGHVLGAFDGDSETHAIAAMLRDQGYAVTVDGDEIEFPTSAPESARDLSDDEDWQETVRAACESEIESALESAYPGAEITVTVEIGSQSALRVSLDAEHPDTYEAIKRLAREASERGYERACR